MLAFMDKFPGWKDFPKGLHVMLIDEDNGVLNDVKTKLEACDYVVTALANGNEALAALRDESKTFHVVLVEATTGDEHDGFKILEAARDLPTIMMSNTENMAIMMKGIAAGASEFLQKPLSDEKLRNLWQHVVRKAVCSGELVIPETLRPEEGCKPDSSDSQQSDPIKVEALVSVKSEPIIELQPADLLCRQENDTGLLETKPDSTGDSLLIPSACQLEQTGSIPAKEDVTEDPLAPHELLCVKAEMQESRNGFTGCEEFLQVKTEGEDGYDESSNLCGLLDVKTKDTVLEGDEFGSLKYEIYSDLQFDDNLELDDSLDDISLSGDLFGDGDALSGIHMDTSLLDESLDISIDCLHDEELQEAESVEEEAMLLAEVANAEKAELAWDQILEPDALRSFNLSEDWCAMDEKKSKKSESDHGGKSSKNAQGKRKIKVDWTPELHRRFVQAVEQLGVDKAIPSRILELMGVQCLTRHNIASHLQKYRSHKKHILAREADAVSWSHRRAASPWLQPQPHHSNPPPIQPRPAMGLAPIQPHPTPAPPGHPLAPPLHVWGHPTVDHSPLHLWQKPAVAAAAWQAADGTFWQPQPPAACLDAWSHLAPAPGTPCYPQPMMRLPLAPIPGVANMALPAHVEGILENGNAAGCGKLANFHPPKETVDAAINEVLNNPWTPLPLGLKPPSLESVIAELQRQGMTTVPPASS